MAINYIKDISESNFLFSHNKNVIEFYSDVNEVVSNCVISVNGRSVTLYPSPTLGFWFNFKEIITALINTNNYSDNLNADISNSYTYENKDHIYLEANVIITVNFLNATTDTDTKTLNFLLSAVNLTNFNTRYPYNIDTTKTLIFSPFINGSNNKYYAKYWAGYPFDVSFFKGLTEVGSMLVTNTANAITYPFPNVGVKGFERLVFSDGRTSTTIEDVLPLVTGYNNLVFDSNESEAFLQLEKADGCTGLYLKWLNKNGGFSYWLFKHNKSQRNFKSLGYLQNDFNNLEDTTEQEQSLGVTSKDTFVVYDSLLTETQKDLILTLLDSPKVYLFTGTPYAQNNFNDWVNVKMRQSKYNLKNVKRDLYNIQLSFELSNNYNIIL